MTVKQYKSTVDSESLNMTLGLIVNPEDIVEINYKEQSIKNVTTGKESKVPRIKQVFEGIKDSKTGKYQNTLLERMGQDGNFIEIKEPAKPQPKKGGQ